MLTCAMLTCAYTANWTNLTKPDAAAMQQMHLSARVSPHPQLARTIADLAAAEQINATHLAEALQYRPQVL